MVDGPAELKLFAALTILLLTFAAGLAPVYFKNTFIFNSRTISIGNCITAGIFLAMALSHILYEAMESEKESQLQNCLSGRLHLHLFLGTFILIFTVECIISKADQQEKPDSEDQFALNIKLKPPQELKLIEPNNQTTQNLLEDERNQVGPPEIEQNSRVPDFSKFILVAGAMSLHSISTGLALGVQKTYQSVLSILLGRRFFDPQQYWLTKPLRQSPSVSMSFSILRKFQLKFCSFYHMLVSLL